MDYSRLRATALRDGEDEEAVTVDTRALIDKVLARYSGEWTTLRELIQNAADAQADTVKIKWETLPSTSVALPANPTSSDLLKHTIANHTLRRLVVQNDGQPFTKTDWGRLKRIAEGNPDETKIGAFGVGFYSVFADCEEPFVSSGDEAMAFYWKGNALFTKKTTLPPDQCSPDTAFVLDYRNTTTPLPNLLSVSQFLATSLTFVSLNRIEFWIDNWNIMSLQKKLSPTASVPIPRNLETRTREGLMTVTAVGRTSTQIDASFMGVIGWKPQKPASTKQSDAYGAGAEVPSLRSFFSRLTASASHAGLRGKAHKEEAALQETIAEDVTKLSTSTIFLRATAASIVTKVPASFSTELERATKKPPPKTTKIAILTSSFDETQASEESSSDATSKSLDVFASVLPSKKPGGRIFIGFPTTQTTGAGMHVSAPSVIPTVEREAIDLNARWVRTWNIEMLRATGIVTRLAFMNEMSDLDLKLRKSVQPGAKMTDKEVGNFMPEAVHILKTFTFGDSTPSGQVAQIIEEAFWTSFKTASIEVYSSRGVLSTSQVRIDSEEVSKFVDGIPVVPSQLRNDPFVTKLIDFGLINPITVDDIHKELGAKALDKDQLIHFILWAGRKSLIGELDPPSRARLLDVAVASVGGDGGDQGQVIALGSITNYLVPNVIPASLPIPPNTIPYAFTSTCGIRELKALGWEPLEIVPWLRFLLAFASEQPDDQNMTKSPKFAVQVLTTISKAWDNLNPNMRNTVVTLLQAHTVMPTKMGMRKPTESFFPSVKLFDDLPTMEVSGNLKEKFLVAIGVRKTVDLDTIFHRLLNPSSEKAGLRWSHMELIRYLASVQDDIPAADLKKLTTSRICPAEAGPQGLEPTKGTKQLYKVSDLFEPKDALRALGLPLLQWPGPPGSFRITSTEGKFLVKLGLRLYPSVPELVDMMAGHDEERRVQAMTYFIANHHINGYGSFNLATSPKAFLPIQGNEKKLVPPSACFTNEAAAILGFDILRRDLHVHANKFGVEMDPPITNCVSQLLARPPQDHRMATKLFAYFALRLGDLGGSNLARLKDAPIVPVHRTKAPDGHEKSGAGATSVTHISPRRCYLGSSTTYGDIFDFVDFGGDANAFLFKCGAKTEPTKHEIAQLACSEPARLLSTLQSPEKYLSLLKSLAENLPALKKDKDLFRKMKTAPFLLASKDITPPPKDKLVDLDDEDEGEPIKQYQLAPANRIAVLDDIISYSLFRDRLIVAPEDEILEDFYLELGAQTLSSLVSEEVKIGPHAHDQRSATELRKHVLERSKIFLHEYGNYRRESIRHDSKWLEKNLTVEAVRSVALRRTLKIGHAQSHLEKRSAASVRLKSGWVLYVAAGGPPDMYQVGQAICQLLLVRPNQQAYLFFEPFLTLDLLGLRARGYNVDRILRAKAAQARIAEEERRKALEAEQRKIQEREEQWNNKEAKAAEAAREAPKTPKSALPAMPGAFGSDSPEDAQPAAANDPWKRGTGGFFSNITRRLGFDTDHDADQKPPQLPAAGVSGGGDQHLGPPAGGSQSGQRKPMDDGRVTSPAKVEQNLLNAIQATRSHDSNHLFSPPRVNEVKEQATYCDSTPAKNIVFVAEASNGMKVYAAKDVSADPARFLGTHRGAINMFAALLVEVGNVYSLSPNALHMFYDETGGTIAFNSNGSIFCNLRFFLQLHADKLVGSRQSEAKAEVAVWWWVVLAHELAHNLVEPHNSDHSYYTESFIQQYFGKMMAKAQQWRMAANPTTPSVSERAPPAEGSSQRQRPPQRHDPLSAPPPYSESNPAVDIVRNMY